MNDNKSNVKNEQLKNVAGGAKIEQLGDNDLSKVAGGFEIARPLPEFIKSNLKSEKKSSDHMDKSLDIDKETAPV